MKSLTQKLSGQRFSELSRRGPGGSASGGRQGQIVTISSIVADAAHEDRLKRLTTLLEVARLLTSELDLPEIVRQVLVKAIAVIPAADAGTLYLEDPTTGRLVVSDSVGFGPSIFKLTLEPGEGCAGRAFSTGKGAIYPDAKTCQDVLATTTPETCFNFREASQGMRSPKAAMSVPLISKGTLLGALVVDALQNEITFTAVDLAMLEDFAKIAAIAIVNARLYGSEHDSRVRLEVLNGEITRQRDELNRRISALDAMSQIARQELGLAPLASRLADLTSSKAYILDGLARVRACEPAQTCKEHLKDIIDSERCVDLLRRVGENHRPHSAVVDGSQLTVSPIVSGADFLGYVMVEATQPALPSVNEAITEMAALFASTVFVRERALEEGTVRRRADLLEQLLDGDVPKSASSFRALPPPLRLAVGKLRPHENGQTNQTANGNVLREVRAIVEQVLRTQATPTVASIRGEYIVLAWSAAPRKGRLNVTHTLETIASAVLASTSSRMRFALTEAIGDPQQIPQIYQEARLAVDMRPWTENVIIDASALGAYRLIIGAASSRHVADFSRRTLAVVVEHDRKRNGCLLKTLRMYLANGSSLSLAARALGVHVHTVQYRLTKLEELTGLSLHNSEDRLTLELALRIFDLVGSERERSV
jgi:PucR C-terminal helix-turn-helix domain/GAF domain/GGDEF-like domain